MKLNVAKKYKEIKYKIFDLSQKNQTMVWKNIWIPPKKSQGFLPGFLGLYEPIGAPDLGPAEDRGRDVARLRPEPL
jgi:hypothetical protein